MAFQIYNVGGASEVLLQDPRVVADIGIAYLTDLHLSPGRAAAGSRYGSAADWWDRAFGRPAGMLQRLLGEIADAGVELVVFGGDNLDFYDADLARELEEMCAARHLRSCFVFGNHDWESAQSRFETHDVDAPEREQNRAALASIWHMTPPVQAVDMGGIRILLLDMRYQHDVDLHAVVEAHALSQLRELLASGQPTLVFHHYPFALPSLQHRLRAVWRGVLACARIETNETAFELISTCPDVLATFSGHAHINSEDPIAAEDGPWQFATGAGVDGIWRYIRVSSGEVPKSLRTAGTPAVEPQA